MQSKNKPYRIPSMTFLQQPESTWQNLLELAFLATAILLLVVYHIILVTIYFVVPNKSVLLTNLQVRKRWAVRMTEQHDVLAIQTLRNVLMASSFFGTSCMLVLIWCATEVVTTRMLFIFFPHFNDFFVLIIVTRGFRSPETGFH